MYPQQQICYVRFRKIQPPSVPLKTDLPKVKQFLHFNTHVGFAIQSLALAIFDTRPAIRFNKSTNVQSEYT